MSQPADLALSGLTRRYGAAVAVDDVTLRIEAGEMVALLGPSGCGKTTTLRMIAGLVAPSAGEIYIAGRPVAAVPVHKRNIGMLFQNYALFPHLTVAQNVAFGLEMRGVRRAEAARLVAGALALVQLGGFGDRMPAQLSGGQQQRVALARALVFEPSVLLLDEPLGALDKGLRESMQMELRQLQRRLNITSVIVTHDQEEALTVADRIVVMRDGRLEQVGTPQEIYARPATRFVAGFVGASNFLQGRLAGSVEGGRLVVLPGGHLLAIPGQPGGEGQMVTVALRPEAITMAREAGAEPGPNRLPARVAGVTYRGPSTQIKLALLDGTELVAVQQNREGGAAAGELRPGHAVLASWEPASNHVLASPA